ncbi:MAG: Polyketide synthase modules and related proteins [uncultured Corynebacteriales bacterium]|uniref:Polyketide synthase modules and related proteins n=1 Tax=uncultured Mycobacteriales bacterium TaxID=581187 RepID=A0A6J4H2A8_9ACTN|nr:MAG: Polyketide synthase modules and related proteins [uncultured Corynebacteriales bacterium]
MSSSPSARTDLAGAPFARALASFGDRTAVVTPEESLSYRDLAARVAATARRLGGPRRLVLLAAGNTLDSLVGYLAAVAAGHPVILVPGDTPAAVEPVVAAYDPDVVIGAAGGSWTITERRAAPAHALHPELALLLSTSGSTGSPKLVRLSYGNLQANAESIADYLGIEGGDRAATTLPMHYSYGLSVVNSHLLRGASLLLTDRSVADPAFWELFGEHRGTTLAGVPYTFDLLDRVGFDTMRLPHLRYVTQAGGRLAPDRVRRYAALGRRDGWDFVVMYGQTEATARMAYLPPALAPTHPHCVGVPIPGGSFRLEPVPELPGPDSGELVYAGPNVMLGYAGTPADLGLGRTVDELHTGDLARRSADGLYELVGRRSGFVKIAGVRIDPHGVEAVLAAHGLAAGCVGADDRLVVAVEGTGDAEHVRRLVARHCRLPAGAVRVRFLAELPRLANGKIDHPALTAATDDPDPVRTPPADLPQLFAEILGASRVTEDSTFVGLGGDSLSYVAMSIRLEEALGHLPADWPTTPIRDLRRAVRRPAGRSRTLDTGVALRAVAILAIVGTHAGLFDLPGGAHLLLAVAGFNVARFHLTPAARSERARGIGRGMLRIALPSMVWIAFAFTVLHQYSMANVLLVDYLVDPGGHNDFWFIETLVYLLAVLAVAVAVPLVDRAERRFPFALPLALCAAGLVARYQLVPGVDFPTPVVAVWLFALGWAAAKAGTDRQRLYVTLAAVATVPGFHGDLPRELLMMAGMVLLTWVPTVPGSQLVNRVAGTLAGSSLYIYLTHWQVYPHLRDESPLLAWVASLAVGIGCGTLATRATALTGRATALAARRRRSGSVDPTPPGPAARATASD